MRVLSTLTVVTYGWNAGRVHAKRIKSFLRFLVTEDSKLEMPVSSDDSATDARHQTTVQEYYSVKPLSEPLVGSPRVSCQHAFGFRLLVYITTLRLLQV